MKRKEFKNRIALIKEQMDDSYAITVDVTGLCYFIRSSISEFARFIFTLRFRHGSPYPKRSYWLGRTTSEEGYKNRLEYIDKFEAFSLRWFLYLFY